MNYNIYRDQIQADAAELLCSSTKDFLRFGSSDYMIFDVNRDIFESSTLIRNVLMSCTQQKCNKENNNGDAKSLKLNPDPLEVPFCAFDFKKFLDFCIHYTPNEPLLTSEDLICSWRIADFFNMPDVKNNIIKELGNTLKADSIDTVRRRLSIRSDYSKTEKAQMGKEGLDIYCDDD